MLTRLASLLLAAALALGCNEGPSDSSAAAPGSAGEAAPSGEDVAISHVIEAYNGVLGSAGGVIDSYVRGVGAQGPAAGELDRVILTNPGALFDLGIRDGRKGLDAARQAAPDLAIVGDAQAMLDRAVELVEAYREAMRYYDADAYKDDGGAGAAALHDKVTAAVIAYQDAQRKVATALDAREQEELAREVARHDPATMSHWFRKTLLAAKALLASMRAGDDGAAFVAAHADFEKTARELDAFARSKPDAPHAFKIFHEGVRDNFAPRAAKIARALRDAADPSVIDADRATLVQYYNHLVQYTDGLFDLEAQGQLR